MMVFDLDPGAPADIVQCCQVGLWLRDLLGKMKLKRLPKRAARRVCRFTCRSIRRRLSIRPRIYRARSPNIWKREHPDLVTSNMSKALRKGKVFVDWSQNDEHKTTICVYSFRAKEEPTVSTPVTWDEVANCLKKKKADLLKFPSDKTLSRVEKIGVFRPSRDA